MYQDKKMMKPKFIWSKVDRCALIVSTAGPREGSNARNYNPLLA